MKDAMISVRMPSNLVSELKELAEENHYLDLSEQIREIIRIKCASQIEQTPKIVQKKQVSQEISESSNDKEKNDREKLVQNLQALLEQLKNEL